MKLHPKAAKFCPGCPDSLKLTNNPVMTAQFVTKQNDTKTITIVGKREKKSNSASLF